MDFRQLEAFASTARHLSFSRAAEELYISQPTVSAYIGSLEKDLGVQLLVRSTKDVSLTAAGREFLTYASKILSLREQAVCDVRGENRDVKGVLNIIASTIPAQFLLPELIASFKKERPNVRFCVDQTDSRTVPEKMRGFRYDFGMAGTLPDASRFISRPVYDDELVLALPLSYGQSGDEIRAGFAGFLRSVPFIMRESGSGTRTEIEALLMKIGVGLQELNVPAYLPDAGSILLAVSLGLGVSLVSKVAAAPYIQSGRLRTVEMQSPLFYRQIFLLHSKELWLSPVQRDFAEHASQYFGGGGNG